MAPEITPGSKVLVPMTAGEADDLLPDCIIVLTDGGERLWFAPSEVVSLDALREVLERHRARALQELTRQEGRASGKPPRAAMVHRATVCSPLNTLIDDTDALLFQLREAAS